jgi:hypothetical protein
MFQTDVVYNLRLRLFLHCSAMVVCASSSGVSDAFLCICACNVCLLQPVTCLWGLQRHPRAVHAADAQQMCISRSCCIVFALCIVCNPSHGLLMSILCHGDDYGHAVISVALLTLLRSDRQPGLFVSHVPVCHCHLRDFVHDRNQRPGPNVSPSFSCEIMSLISIVGARSLSSHKNTQSGSLAAQNALSHRRGDALVSSFIKVAL